MVTEQVGDVRHSCPFLQVPLVTNIKLPCLSVRLVSGYRCHQLVAQDVTYNAAISACEKGVSAASIASSCYEELTSKTTASFKLL